MKSAAVLGAVIVIGFVQGSSVNAASFSCAKASTAQEKLICATPELSKLDDRLAAQFRITLSNVSADGKKGLRTSQQSWLSFVRNVCAVNDRGTETADCLKTVYEQRIAFLAHAVFRNGHYRFIQIDRYLAVKDSEVSSRFFPGYATWHQIFPEMDGNRIRDPLTRQWNAERGFKNKLEADPDPVRSCTDNEDLAEVTFASAHFISVRMRWVQTCGAVTEGRLSGAVFVATPQGPRKLVPEDLFKPETRWFDVVAPAVIESCRSATGENFSQEFADETDAAVRALHSLIMTDDGIEISHTVDNGSLHPPYCSAQFSWHQLRPYLVRYPFDRIYNDRVQ